MSSEALKKIEVCFCSRVGLLWVPSFEEIRVERAIAKMVSSLKTPYKVQTWSVTKGIEPFKNISEPQVLNSLDDEIEAQLPAEALVKASAPDGGRVVTLFRDLSSFLKSPEVIRAAKDAHRRISELPTEQAKQIVIVDHQEPPISLHGVIVIDWPLPDREELSEALESILESLSDKEELPSDEEKDQIISAGLGLDSEEFEVAIARSYVHFKGKIVPESIAHEKQRIVRGGGLVWQEPDPRGMNGVGGLELLKQWLSVRKLSLTKAAREYGLPVSRGIMLVGPPGAGKSLVAKCVATAWEIPYLQLDMSMMFGSLLGESEQRVNRALQTAEAVAPCILHIDEIEKALAHGDRDGGTAFRIFGRFLSWMQDHREGVFVVATANQIERMPPEFLRAGRWDQIWLIDLPTTVERQAIVEVMKSKYKHCNEVDAETIAGELQGFTGAEIESAVINAMTKAFSEKERDVTTSDIINEGRAITPISKSMKEQITTMRRELQNIARPASLQELAKLKTGAGRRIDRTERSEDN